MKTISEEYLEQNRLLHETNSKFGASGHAWTDRVVAYIDKCEAISYLDYGCGKGQLADAVQAARPQLWVGRYDPVTHPETPVIADFVTCCDVLEHFEPELLDAGLHHISTLIGKQGLLVISLRKSNKTLPDGRNAHLIVENEKWWLKRLEPHFGRIKVKSPIKEKRIGKELAVIVKPA